MLLLPPPVLLSCRELLLDRASKIAWKVMTDSDSDICRLIEDTASAWLGQ